jgi:hypothetical protein
MARGVLALAGTAAALGAFALLLIAFLAAPLIVLAVFILGLGALDRARARR